MIIENLILFAILLSVIGVVFSKKNIVSLIYLSLFSALIALKFYIEHAPDIALTEVSLGAALSILVYIILIKNTEEKI